MKILSGIVLGIALCLTAQPGLSDAKPDSAVPLDAREVGNKFHRKTWKWQDGYAYFGPVGLFQASRKLRESAEGNWYVKQPGLLCVKADWKTILTESPFETCWQLARDGSGQLWIAPEGSKKGWNKFNPKKELAHGNIGRYEFQYARIKRKLIDARWLDHRTLREMYTGKSWVWEDSIAYFGKSGIFKVTPKIGKPMIGRWYTDVKGEVCYDIAWGFSGRKTDVKQCWAHARDVKNRLWQSEAGDLEGWYRFNPATNLVQGDLAAAKARR